MKILKREVIFQINPVIGFDIGKRSLEKDFVIDERTYGNMSLFRNETFFCLDQILSEHYSFVIFDAKQIQERGKNVYVSAGSWYRFGNTASGYMNYERNTEYVKEAVLSVLETAFLKKGVVTVQRIYQRAENVFEGFSLDEVDNQFLMSPFAGFRFQGEMIATNDCNQ